MGLGRERPLCAAVRGHTMDQGSWGRTGGSSREPRRTHKTHLYPFPCTYLYLARRLQAQCSATARAIAHTAVMHIAHITHTYQTRVRPRSHVDTMVHAQLCLYTCTMPSVESRPSLQTVTRLPNAFHSSLCQVTCHVCRNFGMRPLDRRRVYDRDRQLGKCSGCVHVAAMARAVQLDH